MSDPIIFGLGASTKFADAVANIGYDYYTWPYRVANTHHEERRPDGEAYTTSQANVRGRDVFVISSLYGDNEESVDEKFVKLCIFINTLRHASAGRITVVAPYLAYARQDRKTESRAPIATQAVSMMLEAVGMDRLLTMDVHNLGAEQNAFRVPIDNLEAKKLLADAVAAEDDGVSNFVVITPDAGGAKRAKDWQAAFQKRINRPVGFAYADKTRLGAEEVTVKIIGSVANSKVIVVDDMIGTGRTIGEIESAVKEQGGELWAAVATHGLFVGSAAKWLVNVPRIYITDTVKPFRLNGQLPNTYIEVVPTTSMFASAIHRINTEGGSISELLEDD
jgi:ribose-phosphate pyrophosphokinase